MSVCEWFMYYTVFKYPIVFADSYLWIHPVCLIPSGRESQLLLVFHSKVSIYFIVSQLEIHSAYFSINPVYDRYTLTLPLFDRPLTKTTHLFLSCRQFWTRPLKQLISFQFYLNLAFYSKFTELCTKEMMAFTFNVLY